MSKKTEIMKAMDECVANACEQMKALNSEERFHLLCEMGEWSDRCFKNQEELLEFFGYEMIEDLNADAVYARRVETFTDQDAKKLMKFSDAGNQIKVMGAK